MKNERRNNHHAAAAAKSLQSCPTLCDPTDGSLPGSPSLGFSRQPPCTVIQKLKTESHKQLHANKVDKLEEMDKFLEIYNLPRQNQENEIWDFPCSPEVRPPHFHFRGMGSIPGQGAKIPQSGLHGQKKTHRKQII